MKHFRTAKHDVGKQKALALTYRLSEMLPDISQ